MWESDASYHTSHSSMICVCVSRGVWFRHFHLDFFALLFVAGNCYFVDSTFSNSWRELRIINSTMNISYIEYDPAFEFVTNSSSGEGLQYYELYDVSEDVYQVSVVQ